MSVNIVWDSLSGLFLLTKENYQVWLSVSKGYDGTVGGTKTTAEQSVSAGRCIWTVIGVMKGRDDLLCGSFMF